MVTEMKELAVSLYEIRALKFGEFITKVGLKTTVYLDLRVIISHPKILKKLSKVLWALSEKSNRVTQICGVPYAALPIAIEICVESGLRMLIRRKEAKSYGTKKLIKGTYKPGETCVIIEDVVTSGSSILEAVADLRKEGLVVTEAYVVVDRELGGKKNIENSGINMKSLFTLTQLLQYLFEAGKLTQKDVTNVAEYLKECKVDTKSLVKDETKRLRLEFSNRAELSQGKSPMACKIFELMTKKESTVCLAADLTKASDILALAELAGPHIVVLKTHVDIIEDFNQDFVKRLKELSKEHNFLLMEDRKFGDIGNTVSLQYTAGAYKISEWADLVTVHPIAGPEVLNAFKKAFEKSTEPRGIFLITEMSSKGALTDESYAHKSIAIGDNSNFVVGHVCQSNAFSDPCLIQLTPGVKLCKASDNLGQQYNTPQSVVMSGADLAVVGRGITEESDKLKALLEYKRELWQAYKNRVVS